MLDNLLVKDYAVEPDDVVEVKERDEVRDDDHYYYEREMRNLRDRERMFERMFEEFKHRFIIEERERV